MLKAQHVIFLPGLGGSNYLFDKLVNSWTKFGFVPHSLHMNWRSEESFDNKLQRLMQKVDELNNKGEIVSIVGTSAGGSMALNAFSQRPDAIHRVVSICGRLRAGENVFPSLDLAAKGSLSFKDSVVRFEKQESALSAEARKRIMTVRPLLDETVPISTMTLEGAENIRIYAVEHVISITAAMSIGAKPIVRFLI